MNFVINKNLDPDCACLCVTESNPSGIGICYKPLRIETFGGPITSPNPNTDRVCVKVYGDFAACQGGQTVTCDQVSGVMSIGIAGPRGTIEVTGNPIPIKAPPDTRAASLCTFSKTMCFNITSGDAAFEGPGNGGKNNSGRGGGRGRVTIIDPNDGIFTQEEFTNTQTMASGEVGDGIAQDKVLELPE